LYDTREQSRYWFRGGFSLAAIIALVVGGVASIPAVDVSWVVGLPVAFVVYLLLRRVTRIDGHRA